MENQGYKNLLVWQKSIILVKNLYQLTSTFPKDEIYGLTSQMRRAGISVPSNIAEGYGRYSKKELCRFIKISLGSSAELETQAIISQELGYINNEQLQNILDQINEVQKMLTGLMNSSSQN
ncbi:four helix bundle protein [Candidatus Kuenenbacteria bacterium]|nr:four helix bundle protein [Candidatus Kuenenbacteria bacterium]